MFCFSGKRLASTLGAAAGAAAVALWVGVALGQAAPSKGAADQPKPPAAGAQDAPKDVPKDTPKDTTDRAPKDTTDRAPKDTTDRAPKDTTDRAPKDTTDRAPKDTTDRAPKDTTDRAPKDTTDRAPKDTTDRAPKVTSDRSPRESDADRDPADDARDSARRTFRSEDLRGPDLGLWFERSTRDGLVIADLATEGAIADLGFREGDRIVSVNGRRAASEREFITLLSDDQLRDQRIKVGVMRGGRQEVILVRPSALLEPASTVSTSRLEDFGIILDDRVDNRVVVWRVVPRSPAFYAGIRPKDVILSFGGERIAAGPDLVRVIEKAEPGEVAVQVNRGDRTRTIQAEMTAMEARTAARPIPDTPGEVRRDGRRDLREDRALDRQDRLRRRVNPSNP